MSPEAPGNLVVLDLHFRNADLTGSIERVTPPQEGYVEGWLQVRFDARTKEPGFVPVGGGAVWVRAPKGYLFSPRESAGQISHGDSEYFHNNVALGDGLMLVLVLPKGYTLADSQPVPRNAKIHKGRIAVYFKPAGNFGADTRTTWRLEKFEGDVKAEVARLRGEILRRGKIPANLGALVDEEDPARKAPVPPPGKPGTAGWLSGNQYLVWLAAGIGLLVFYLYRINTLPPGAQNQVYYVVLLFAATACAIALFTGLGSSATITYKRYGIAVRLGGAAALFALIVYGGFKLVPSGPDTLDLTVRAHSADGKDPIITSGKVTVDLDNDRRTQPFGANGEADFKGIPARFSNRPIRVLPEVDGYEGKWQASPIHDGVIDVALNRLPPSVAKLMGSIVNPPANLKKIRILIDGQDAVGSLKEFGRFEIPVNGKDGDRVRVKVYDGDKLVYDDYQTLPGPVTLLIKKPK